MLTEPRGNIAAFDISGELLLQALRLPNGASIERMHVSNDDPHTVTVVISHPDFREVFWGEWIPKLVSTARYENGRLVIEWEETP